AITSDGRIREVFANVSDRTVGESAMSETGRAATGGAHLEFVFEQPLNQMAADESSRTGHEDAPGGGGGTLVGSRRATIEVHRESLSRSEPMNPEVVERLGNPFRQVPSRRKAGLR